jgi:hypothetical protein
LSRIFISLSVFPVLLVFVTMGVGWWIGDYNGIYSHLDRNTTGSTEADKQLLLKDLDKIAEPQRRFRMHFQLGLASALATVLINSLSVTYLIGTSRWVKEVCQAYELDASFIEQSAQLKRQTFPWSIAGFCSILTIVALGAAADPGTLRETTARWVTPHLIAAMIGSSIIVIAIIVQAMNLHRNAEIIAEVAEVVKRERISRGLPVE